MIDTTHFRTALEAELAALEKELATIGVHDPKDTKNWTEMTADMDNVSADEIDVADKTEEWIERRGTVAALETQYNNIVRALAKIDAGTYGVCEISGEHIEEARLNANPSARTCIAHREEEGTLPR